MSIDEIKNDNDSNQTAVTSSQEFNEQDKELLLQSQNDYKNRQYSSSLRSLQKLVETYKNNPKLLLNQALCEYAASSFKNLEGFRKQLENIGQMMKINIENYQTIEDPEHCIIYYNYAIILYYFKHFNKCLSIVEKIYEFIEALDEDFAKQVYSLLIDLYITTYQPSKALNILGSFEKLVRKETNDSDASSPTNELLTVVHQENLFEIDLISIFKLKAYVQKKSFSLCEKELKYLSSTSLLNKNPFLLHLKCYYEYSVKNYSKCLEMISFLMQQPVQVQQQQLFQLKNDKLSLNNNLACIHFYLKKFSLSTLYMKRAINDNSKYLNDFIKQMQQWPNEPFLYSLHLNKKYELLYNLGVIQLFNKQPLNAFDCFIECINKYKTNARVWLRISECCMMIYRQNQDVCKLNERLKCVSKSIGMSIYHKIIFAPKLSKTTTPQQIQTQQPCLEFAYACLKNAYFILTSVDENISTGSNNSIDDPESHAHDGFLHEKTTNISPQLTSYSNSTKFHKLECSILTSLAYVSLCCFDYLNTIRYCNALLIGCKNYLSKGNKYLALNYLSEALVYADKLTEAIENLNMNIDIQADSDISFDLSQNFDEEKQTKIDLCNWYPRDTESAKAIVYYNLSVAHAIRGEVDMAYRNFNRCVVQFGKLNLQPANTYFMKIYLDLIDGNRQNLQTLLYDFFRHATINNTYQSLQSTQQAFIKSQSSSSSSSSASASATSVIAQQNTTQSTQFINTAHPIQQQPQLQNVNQNFLQSHPQLIQLAQQQQQQAQQQQFFNQFNSAGNPSSAYTLPNPFHLSSFPTTNSTPGIQQQQINAAAAAYQNLNSSTFNFTTQNVNQLFQQQQATPQFHSRIN